MMMMVVVMVVEMVVVVVVVVGVVVMVEGEEGASVEDCVQVREGLIEKAKQGGERGLEANMAWRA